MSNPKTIRVKARVNVGGMKVGEVANIRYGYAKTLIEAGYVVSVEALEGALSAEPSRYGDWTEDPRNDEGDPDTEPVPEVEKDALNESLDGPKESTPADEAKARAEAKPPKGD